MSDEDADLAAAIALSMADVAEKPRQGHLIELDSSIWD